MLAIRLFLLWLLPMTVLAMEEEKESLLFPLLPLDESRSAFDVTPRSFSLENLQTNDITDDGALLVFSTGEVATIWDARRQVEVATLRFEQKIKKCFFTPLTNVLIVALASGEVFSYLKGEKKLLFENSVVNEEWPTFAPGGHHVATLCGHDSECMEEVIRTCSLDKTCFQNTIPRHSFTQKDRFCFTSPAYGRRCMYTDHYQFDGKTGSTFVLGTIHYAYRGGILRQPFVSVSDFPWLRALWNKTGETAPIGITPRHGFVYLEHGPHKNTTTLKIIDCMLPKIKFELVRCEKALHEGLFYLDDGKSWLVIPHDERSLTVFDLNGHYAIERRNLTGDRDTISFSRDGSTVHIEDDGITRVWDPLHRQVGSYATEGVEDIAVLSPDGRKLFICDEGKIEQYSTIEEEYL